MPAKGAGTGSAIPLRDIQKAIAGALFQRLASGDTMQRTSAEVAERLIKPNDRLSSFERLQIYNQQYWWRIMGAFQEDFRGLLAVLGERRFEKLAVAYLEAFGSTSWNLRDLGQHLEAFLQEHPGFASPYEALALDMVRIEWARVIAFDGPERKPIDPANLGPAPERLRFALQPYVTLLSVKYPVDQLLGRLRRQSIETGSVSNAVSSGRRRGPIRLRSKPERSTLQLAVHRVDLSVYYKRLEPEAFRLLTSLRAGATLGDACSAAFAESPAPPKNAAELIRGWFATWTRLQWLIPT